MFLIVAPCLLLSPPGGDVGPPKLSEAVAQYSDQEHSAQWRDSLTVIFHPFFHFQRQSNWGLKGQKALGIQ